MKLPNGFRDLFPYIFVTNANEYFGFLERAFGATVLGKTLSNSGLILNARVRIGETSFMVSEASNDYPATDGAYYLFVENAVASHDRAIRAGGQNVFNVGDMPYGDRQGGVRDIKGNIWWISQRIADGGYD